MTGSSDTFLSTEEVRGESFSERYQDSVQELIWVDSQSNTVYTADEKEKIKFALEYDLRELEDKFLTCVLSDEELGYNTSKSGSPWFGFGYAPFRWC